VKTFRPSNFQEAYRITSAFPTIHPQIAVRERQPPELRLSAKDPNVAASAAVLRKLFGESWKEFQNRLAAVSVWPAGQIHDSCGALLPEEHRDKRQQSEDQNQSRNHTCSRRSVE
jgi:hypothetical protein